MADTPNTITINGEVIDLNQFKGDVRLGSSIRVQGRTLPRVITDSKVRDQINEALRAGRRQGREGAFEGLQTPGRTQNLLPPTQMAPSSTQPGLGVLAEPQKGVHYGVEATPPPMIRENVPGQGVARPEIARPPVVPEKPSLREAAGQVAGTLFDPRQYATRGKELVDVIRAVKDRRWKDVPKEALDFWNSLPPAQIIEIVTQYGAKQEEVQEAQKGLDAYNAGISKGLVVGSVPFMKHMEEAGFTAPAGQGFRSQMLQDRARRGVALTEEEAEKGPQQQVEKEEPEATKFEGPDPRLQEFADLRRQAGEHQKEMTGRERSVTARNEILQESGIDTSKSLEDMEVEQFSRLGDVLNSQLFWGPSVTRIGAGTGAQQLQAGGAYQMPQVEFEDMRQQVINRARRGDKLAYQELGRMKEANDVLYKIRSMEELNINDLEKLSLVNDEQLRQMMAISEGELRAELRRFDSDIQAKMMLREAAAKIQMSEMQLATVLKYAQLRNFPIFAMIAGLVGVPVANFLASMMGQGAITLQSPAYKQGLEFIQAGGAAPGRLPGQGSMGQSVPRQGL